MIKKNLFDNEGAKFMGSHRNQENCSIGIFGVNFDGTTSYKPGARFGPNSIRNASQALETFCPKLKKDLKDIKYFDAGSIILDVNNAQSVIKKVNLATKYFLENNLKPIILGGEHSITIGAVEALIKQYPNLILIQLDAHADLRDSYQNDKFSHACTIKRCIDILPTKKIFQIGIRSGTKEEFKFMHDNNQLIEINPGDKINLIKEKLEQYKNIPLYLTIDLDWFDPSLLPGTGTPEPGGFFWHDFENIIQVLNSFKIIGADIVELSPNIDQSGVSSVVAAKVLRTLIMTLDQTS